MLREFGARPAMIAGTAESPLNVSDAPPESASGGRVEPRPVGTMVRRGHVERPVKATPKGRPRGRTRRETGKDRSPPALPVEPIRAGRPRITFINFHIK